MRSCQYFFTWKFAHKNSAVIFLDHLNQCKVLYMYADITVLIWQKVNEAFLSQKLK